MNEKIYPIRLWPEAYDECGRPIDGTDTRPLAWVTDMREYGVWFQTDRITWHGPLREAVEEMARRLPIRRHQNGFWELYQPGTSEPAMASPRVCPVRTGHAERVPGTADEWTRPTPEERLQVAWEYMLGYLWHYWGKPLPPIPE